MIGHRRPTVLLVDDERSTLEILSIVLKSQGFETTQELDAGRASRLIEQAAARDRPFDAVVTDVFFDGRDEGAAVLAACRDTSPRSIVILMTGQPAVDGAVAAMKMGARDYLQKPVDPNMLATVLHRALKEQQIHREDVSFKDLVNILSDMVAHTIERVDPYTAGHGERTRSYCRQIAEQLGIDRQTIERLELAAIAHDYGKIYLEDLNFLTKKGPLTAQEYRAVQRHPEVGANKLGSNAHLVEACTYIAEHHERWDGTGYPRRLKGSAVSPAGRILCLVEVFDSLTSRRSYKAPWDLEKTIDFFESQSGRAFEPETLDVFLRLLEKNGPEWLNAPKKDLENAGIYPEKG
ncbi:MAG: response regulator [Planctomycetota bacterium]|nr:response regulator [Planctomycetota bacterium]